MQFYTKIETPKTPGDPFFVHEHVPVYADRDQLQTLFQERKIAVNPSVKRVALTAGFYDYHVPTTMPPALRGSFSGHKTVVEIICDDGAMIEKIVYEGDGIVVVTSAGSIKVLYDVLSQLGFEKRKEQILSSNLK